MMQKVQIEEFSTHSSICSVDEDSCDNRFGFEHFFHQAVQIEEFSDTSI